MVSELAVQHRVPFFYCNGVGGNDELVFDGNSFVIDKKGQTTARLAAFAEQIAVVDGDGPVIPEIEMSPEEEIFRALVLGVRDYFTKCGFRSAVLGYCGRRRRGTRQRERDRGIDA
jgi:NAD+ synthase/NAD+ synthase (glutamine-hydrolysing)